MTPRILSAWPTGNSTIGRTQLCGVEDVLALPVDNPRSPVSSRSEEMVTEVLDGATYDALSALARSHGVTVFMVVHSVIAVLLARECVTDDVVVGAAVSPAERSGAAERRRNDGGYCRIAHEDQLHRSLRCCSGRGSPCRSGSNGERGRPRSTTSLRRSIRRAG